jgi:hypothetical protein
MPLHFVTDDNGLIYSIFFFLGIALLSSNPIAAQDGLEFKLFSSTMVISDISDDLYKMWHKILDASKHTAVLPENIYPHHGVGWGPIYADTKKSAEYTPSSFTSPYTMAEGVRIQAETVNIAGELPAITLLLDLFAIPLLI